MCFIILLFKALDDGEDSNVDFDSKIEPASISAIYQGFDNS
jgi:hypothetical protein